MALQVLKDGLPEILKEIPAIRLVYLFGSQVEGQVGPISDYDLAILCDDCQDDFLIQTRFQHTLSMLLDTERVDVVVINRAPVELAYHVISSGILLYQSDLATRVEFEAHVLGKYGDYLPTLRSFKQQTLRGDPDGKRVQRYREAIRRTQRTLGEARTSSRPPSL